MTGKVTIYKSVSLMPEHYTQPQGAIVALDDITSVIHSRWTMQWSTKHFVLQSGARRPVIPDDCHIKVLSVFLQPYSNNKVKTDLNIFLEHYTAAFETAVNNGRIGLFQRAGAREEDYAKTGYNFDFTNVNNKGYMVAISDLREILDLTAIRLKDHETKFHRQIAEFKEFIDQIENECDDYSACCLATVNEPVEKKKLKNTFLKRAGITQELSSDVSKEAYAEKKVPVPAGVRPR